MTVPKVIMSHYKPHPDDPPHIARAKAHLARAASMHAQEAANGVDRARAGAMLRAMNAAHVDAPLEQPPKLEIGR